MAKRPSNPNTTRIIGKCQLLSLASQLLSNILIRKSDIKINALVIKNMI